MRYWVYLHLLWESPAGKSLPCTFLKKLNIHVCCNTFPYVLRKVPPYKVLASLHFAVSSVVGALVLWILFLLGLWRGSLNPNLGSTD